MSIKDISANESPAASVNLGLCIMVTILVVITALPVFTWSEFQREGGVGPLDYELRADFDASGFMYNMSVKSSENEGIGGKVNISVER